MSIRLNPKGRARIDRYLMKKYGPYCQYVYCHKFIDRTLPINHPYCWSRDHIIPLSRGGTNAITNFRPMHKTCNQKQARRDGI